MARMKTETEKPARADNVVQLHLAKKDKRRAEDKWSAQVLKRGYTLLPSLLLKAQGRLGITPTQMNVLIQLTEHWWEADRNPHPAKDRIADRMGKSSRMVQRYLTQLEKAGIIRREARYTGKDAQTSNAYSLSGLVSKLKAIEPEFAKLAEQTRLKRKKLEGSAA
jgi:predicted transcriptional regulator